jgi:hypothetical protein
MRTHLTARSSLALLLTAGLFPIFAAAPAVQTPPATRPASPEMVVPAPFNTPLKWKASGILVKPVSDEDHTIVSVKDPTVVRFNDRWHIYATVYSTSSKNWSIVYLNFKDWADAADAKPYYIDSNPNLRGYHCAPQIFYFRPHK